MKIYSVLYFLLMFASAAVVPFQFEFTQADVVFWFFIFMSFLPEWGLITNFGNFRKWIGGGLEDGDGQLNKADVKEMMMHYVAIWFLRIFIHNNLVESHDHVQVSQVNSILSFAGAGSIEMAIVVLKLFKINELKK